MSVRIEWAHAKEARPVILGRDDDWVGTDDLRPGEVALTLDTGGDVVAIYGTPDEVHEFARKVGALAGRRAFIGTPETHTHQAQDLGEGKHGVFALDPFEDDEQHYYIEHTVTVEGVLVDVYDEHGETLHYSLARTWDEITADAIRRSP